MSSLRETGLEAWVTDVSELLDEADEGSGAAFLAAVQDHFSQPPVIALVGPYTAGKSSLLKRLCVDIGVPVPDELFVDAAPATDRSYEVELGGYRLRDNAGLDSEISRHGRGGIRGALFAEI